MFLHITNEILRLQNSNRQNQRDLQKELSTPPLDSKFKYLSLAILFSVEINISLQIIHFDRATRFFCDVTCNRCRYFLAVVV